VGEDGKKDFLVSENEDLKKEIETLKTEES